MHILRSVVSDLKSTVCDFFGFAWLLHGRTNDSRAIKAQTRPRTLAMSKSSNHAFGWPRLLNLALAAQYACMSEDTFLRICPVPAKDMGFRGLRWDRLKLDEWIDCLPDRGEGQDAEVHANPVPADADERRRKCLERMR